MKFLFHSNHNDRERENNQWWGLVYILIGEIPYLEYGGPIPRRQGCTLHCFTPLRKHRKSTNKQKAEIINTSCEERKMVICDPISDWWSFCYQSPMLYSTMKTAKTKKNKTKKKQHFKLVAHWKYESLIPCLGLGSICGLYYKLPLPPLSWTNLSPCPDSTLCGLLDANPTWET